MYNSMLLGSCFTVQCDGANMPAWSSSDKANGRSCTQEYGCDELTTGDVLYVEGYNDTFKATIYDNEHFNYIPYL